ncbi:Hint domain-containing protein [Cognatishimia sp. SS12]|uniref:Hint domain-containing protein n=1 Tax=Cognatishimia sp. SS12 TaxID=2979465 RepID=UPI00232B7091|nr:Hint domain-containing protein [Cognatishimia sp. SS12]MDC0737046.1 Hint domain-containing protein [Cognatishimia sp. SS12]
MRVRIVNRRLAEQAVLPSFGDNIFAQVQERCGVQAVVPAPAEGRAANVLRPAGFQCTGIDRITQATPADQRGVSCLAATATVVTSAGLRALHDLRAGDLVLTRDNGFQPLLWIGHVAGDKAVPMAIEIAADAIDEGIPSEPLIVSARQRILLSCPEIAAQFGTTEVLARAVDLLHLEGVSEVAAPDSFFALFFARHEVLRVNDAWLDTLQPDAENMRCFSSSQRDAITALCPRLNALPLERSYPAARPSLRRAFARQFQRS